MTTTREVSATLDMSVNGVADIICSIAAARHQQIVDESLTMTIGGVPMVYEEILGPVGSRFHVARGLPVGRMTVSYRATIEGTIAPPVPTPLELIEAIRPSRYCESDVMVPIAQDELRGRTGADLLNAAAEWVNRHIAYVSGSSRPVDAAIDTYLSRRGVCRDFAHLVITLLRAHNVPARLVSVYAPGLNPMDFHAVAEAYLDGTWYALDATRMAPRDSMVRIATGQDTSDTAFLSVSRGFVALHSVEVTALQSGRDLNPDDPNRLVSLC